MSRMFRAPAGAEVMTSSSASGEPHHSGVEPGSSEIAGPRPAGWGPRTSETARTTCCPSPLRHSSARSQSSRTNPSRDRAEEPRSFAVMARSTGSPLTTSASRTCRCPRSSPSRARWTLARVLARAASEVRSLGAGRARSGRRRTKACSCSSLRLRTSSARLLTAVAGRGEEVDTRHTVVGLGTLACRSAQRCQDSEHSPRTRGGTVQAQKSSSYGSGVSDTPLLGDMIGDNLARTVMRVPDAEALVDVPSGRRWTYAELDADVTALALGLLASGIEAGDRIGIWSPNCPEWTLLQYATAKVGALLVNV